MASTGGKVLIGCGVAFLGGSVLLCGGLVALVFLAPTLLLGLMTEDHPLDVPTVQVDAARRVEIGRRACTELARQGRTQVSGEELTQLFLSDPNPPTVLRIEADGDRAAFDISVETEDGGAWINVHARGGMVMEGGWFEHVAVDELTVGGFDLGQYVAGQELKDQANQNLAQQRAQNPEQYAVFDGIERVSVEGGQFVMQVAEGATLPACNDVSLLPEPEPEPEPAAEPDAAEAAAPAAVEEVEPKRIPRGDRPGPRPPGRR